ncbi:hypothetical protein O181_043520, partial [Austropuccinia psidii MF-1]|nr:hypothetical protein [Austropuccinia psidii MF-1]
MSTDELDLSRNPCVLDPDLILACLSWEQFLESTYPTQPPSLNENQTYFTTSTNQPPIFNVEKVQLTQEEFLLSMEKKVKRLKKMIEDPLTLFDNQKIMEALMSSFISKIKCIEDGSTVPLESGIIIGNTSLLPKRKKFSKKKDKTHKRTRFKAVQENPENNVHKDSSQIGIQTLFNPESSNENTQSQTNVTLEIENINHTANETNSSQDPLNSDPIISSSYLPIRSVSNQNLPNLNPSLIAESLIPVSSNSSILSSCSSVIPLASSCIDRNLITPVVINNDSPIPSSSSINPQNNPTKIDSQVSTQNNPITPSHQACSNPNPSTFNSIPPKNDPNSPIFFQHVIFFLQSIDMFENTIGAHHNSLVQKAIHYSMEKHYQQSEQEASFPTTLPCSIRFLSDKNTLADAWLDQFQTD